MSCFLLPNVVIAPNSVTIGVFSPYKIRIFESAPKEMK